MPEPTDLSEQGKRDRTTRVDARDAFDALTETIWRLRQPDGCPWDREQTHASMKADLIEEAYEVLDAIDGDDPDRLADELGDLLLHVAMHACIGEEHGEFSAQDVLTCICSKMIRRHPHVFAQAQAETSEDVLRNWEAIKKDEKSLRTQTEVMRDVPRTFPALMRAAKVQKKARDVGFDWDEAREALEKVREEADEVEEVLQDPEKLAGELGDLLFAAVNVCRMKKVPPEPDTSWTSPGTSFLYSDFTGTTYRPERMVMMDSWRYLAWEEEMSF